LAASLLESLASRNPQILPQGRSIGGLLEAVEPIGGGLVRVVVSGRERLVDEELLETLQGLIGQQVAIGHFFGQWGAGPLSSETPQGVGAL